MGSQPWNLALRFLLELAALAGLGVAGWSLASGFWRWLLVILLPLTAAVLWGVFAVPGDPSRSGGAPVPVPGVVRLVLELAILFAGAAGCYLSGYRTAGLVIATLVLAHYAISYDRIGWLLRG
jgi:hypothetical protein